MATSIADLVANLSVDDQMTPALAKAGQAVDKMAGASDEQYRSVGRGMAAVGAAISAPLIAAGKIASDYSQSIADIMAVGGQEAVANADVIDSTIKRLAAGTRYNAVQTAAGFEELVKAGLSVEDALGGGLAGALDLAAAGGIDVARSAEVMTQGLTTFGDSLQYVTDRNGDGYIDTLEKATHMNDLFAQSAATSMTDVSGLGDSFENVGSSLSSVGQDFETGVALLTAMSAFGTKGAEAGTALKSMTNGLIKNSDALEGIGVAVFDAEGGYRDLIDIFEDLDAVTADWTEKDRSAFLLDVFDSYGQKAATQVLDANDKLGKSLTQIEQDLLRPGAAAEMAAARMDSFPGHVEEMTGAIERLKLSVGTPLLEGFEPGVEAAADGINGVAAAVEELPKPLKKAAALTAAASGAFLTLGGGALFAVPHLRGVARTFGELKQAPGILGGIARGAGLLLRAAGPLGLAAAAGLAAYETNLLGFGDAVDSMARRVRSALPAAQAALEDWGGQVATFADLVRQGDFQAASDMLLSGARLWSDAALGALQAGGDWLAGLADSIQLPSVGDFAAKGAELGSIVGQGLVNGLQAAGGLKDWLAQNLPGALTGIPDAIGGALDGLLRGPDPMAEIVTGAGLGEVPGLGDKFGGFFGSLKDAFVAEFEAAFSTGALPTPDMEAVLAPLREMIDAAASAVGGIFAPLVRAIQESALDAYRVLEQLTPGDALSDAIARAEEGLFGMSERDAALLSQVVTGAGLGGAAERTYGTGRVTGERLADILTDAELFRLEGSYEAVEETRAQISDMQAAAASGTQEADDALITMEGFIDGLRQLATVVGILPAPVGAAELPAEGADAARAALADQLTTLDQTMSVAERVAANQAGLAGAVPVAVSGTGQGAQLVAQQTAALVAEIDAAAPSAAQQIRAALQRVIQTALSGGGALAASGAGTGLGAGIGGPTPGAQAASAGGMGTSLVQQWTAGVVSEINAAAPGAVQQIQSALQGLVSQVSGAMNAAPLTGGQALSQVMPVGSGEVVDAAGPGQTPAAYDATNALGGDPLGLTAMVQSSISSASAALQSGLAQLAASATSGMAMVTSAITSGFSTAAAAAQSGAQQIVAALQAIPGQIAAVAGAAGAAAGSIGDAIVAALQADVGAVQAAAQELAAAAEVGIDAAIQPGSPSRMAIPYGEAIGEGLIFGMEQKSPEVLAAAEALGYSAEEGLQPLLDGFSTTGQAAAKALGVDVEQALAEEINGMKVWEPADQIDPNWLPAFDKAALVLTRYGKRVGDQAAQKAGEAFTGLAGAVGDVLSGQAQYLSEESARAALKSYRRLDADAKKKLPDGTKEALKAAFDEANVTIGDVIQQRLGDRLGGMGGIKGQLGQRMDTILRAQLGQRTLEQKAKAAAEDGLGLVIDAFKQGLMSGAPSAEGAAQSAMQQALGGIAGPAGGAAGGLLGGADPEEFAWALCECLSGANREMLGELGIGDPTAAGLAMLGHDLEGEIAGLSESPFVQSMRDAATDLQGGLHDASWLGGEQAARCVSICDDAADTMGQAAGSAAGAAMNAGVGEIAAESVNANMNTSGARELGKQLREGIAEPALPALGEEATLSPDGMAEEVSGGLADQCVSLCDDMGMGEAAGAMGEAASGMSGLNSQINSLVSSMQSQISSDIMNGIRQGLTGSGLDGGGIPAGVDVPELIYQLNPNLKRALSFDISQTNPHAAALLAGGAPSPHVAGLQRGGGAEQPLVIENHVSLDVDGRQMGQAVFSNAIPNLRMAAQNRSRGYDLTRR